jgi:hypothetical protein
MPPDPALLDRTLASIRSNFESLRLSVPVPALMAEVPQWADSDFDDGALSRRRPFRFLDEPKGEGRVENPQPWKSCWHTPNRVCVGGYVTGTNPHRVVRLIWTSGSLDHTSRLKSAATAAAAAGLVGALCDGSGVPEDFWPTGEGGGLHNWPHCHTTTLPGTAGHWFMGVFLAAAAKPPSSPLRLGGPLGGEVWRVHESAPLAAPEPLRMDLKRDESAVRYWELSNFVDASLWALDLVEVALAAALARGLSSEIADHPQDKSPKKPRGKTAAEILEEWWRDPKLKQQLLAAGSSDGIGHLIGKPGSSVREAGLIWKQKIRPLLTGVRAVAKIDREDERIDR